VGCGRGRKSDLSSSLSLLQIDIVMNPGPLKWKSDYVIYADILSNLSPLLLFLAVWDSSFKWKANFKRQQLADVGLEEEADLGAGKMKTWFSIPLLRKMFHTLLRLRRLPPFPNPVSQHTKAERDRLSLEREIQSPFSLRL